MLKIILCARGVPVDITDVKVVEGGTRLHYRTYDLNILSINESDDYALEQAIVLKKKCGGNITMFTLGMSAAEEVLHIGRVKGVDRAIRIDADFANAETVAEVLSEAIKKLEFDLILAGVESSDNMSSQVGISIAAKLGLSFAYAVTKVEIGEDEKTIFINKEMGGGMEQVMKISLPALLCIQSGIVPLTYASRTKILKDRSKPIEYITLSELPQSMKVKISFLDVFPPPKKGGAEIIDGEPGRIAALFVEKVKEVL